MSRKEVLAVLRGGYRSYLMDAGFEKPLVGEDIIFRHRSFPSREIRIFTTPMFRDQVNYQIHLPELDDGQGLFQFRPDPDYYSWGSRGWLEYRDETDLVNGFDYARQVHESWLNRLFSSPDIAEFADRINGIRRARVAAYAQFSPQEKNAALDEAKEQGNLQADYVRSFPVGDWGKELIDRLSSEGKAKKRISEYWIEGDLLRGPKYDGRCRIIRTRIFVDDVATGFFYFEGQFFDERHRTVRHFVDQDRVFGPPGDPPWIVEFERAKEG